MIRKMAADRAWITATRVGRWLRMDPRVVAAAPLNEWLLLVAAARICQADDKAANEG